MIAAPARRTKQLRHLHAVKAATTNGHLPASLPACLPARLLPHAVASMNVNYTIGLATSWAAPNSLTDMSGAEIQQALLMNNLPPAPAVTQDTSVNNDISIQVTPTSVDWRSAGMVTPVRNQVGAWANSWIQMDPDVFICGSNWIQMHGYIIYVELWTQTRPCCYPLLCSPPLTAPDPP